MSAYNSVNGCAQQLSDAPVPVSGSDFLFLQGESLRPVINATFLPPVQRAQPSQFPLNDNIINI